MKFLLMKLFLIILLSLPIVLYGQIKMDTTKVVEPSNQDIRKELREAKPRNQWEIGVGGGILGYYGDIDYTSGMAGSFHVRKSFDYIFSARVGARFGKFKGEDNFDGGFQTDIATASLQLLVSINPLLWDGSHFRKFNPYLFVGGGLLNYRVAGNTNASPWLQNQDWTVQPLLESGIGIGCRINSRVNFSVETNVLVPFTEKSDLLDGVDREVRDVLAYTSLRLNFNIGNPKYNSEPLFWLNPLDAILQDISEYRNRKKITKKDSDKDGVADDFDKEPNTPKGAIVDTRGITLDSDKDGIPDHEDTNPYEKKPIVNDVFYNAMLPMIHFEADEFSLREREYSNLDKVAQILKMESELRLVVTGFTDKTATEFQNQALSYQRGNTVINYLIQKGIPRTQLILHFIGENDNLVPSEGAHFMNRRVEFRVAQENEEDMKPPK